MTLCMTFFLKLKKNQILRMNLTICGMILIRGTIEQMRCNQVSIFIERFGKYVPKSYPADVQRISVYCDDGTSIYAALSKAYACVINELNEYDHIGARCDVSTNEFSHVNYREMHGTIPIEKSNYEQDFDFQYLSSEKILHEDYIWVYEHRNNRCNQSVCI